MAELNRPENFNGLDDEFASAVQTAQKDAQGDIGEMADMVNGGDVEALRSLAETQLSPQQEAQLDSLLQSKYGLTGSEFRLQVARAVDVEQSAREAAEAAAFMASEPTYERTPENSDRLLGFLQEQGLPITAGSLRYAFHTLNETGALKTVTVRQTSHVGLSDRESQRQNYSGEPEPFDAEAFRTLSPDARKMYAEVVHRAERSGEKAPSVRAFAQSFKRNRMD